MKEQTTSPTATKSPKKPSSSKKKARQKALMKQEQALQQQSQQEVQQNQGGNSKVPKVRLDLNLEAELYLKAKARGDITLTLLS
jgi:hypothetical protein